MGNGEQINKCDSNNLAMSSKSFKQIINLTMRKERMLNNLSYNSRTMCNSTAY